MARSFPDPKLASAGVLLVFALLLLFTLAVLASAVAGHAPGERLVVMAAPLPFYLFALWSARLAIGRIGKGEALRALVSPMLRRIGWALFLGGIAQVFLVPWLWALEGHGSFGYFDVSAITLGAVGVTLVVIARLVAEAERDRAELDEIL
jgi:hypothetical protein